MLTTILNKRERRLLLDLLADHRRWLREQPCACNPRHRCSRCEELDVACAAYEGVEIAAETRIRQAEVA